MRRLPLLLSVLLISPTFSLLAQDLKVPLKSGSVRFAVIGDMGTGDVPQYDVAKQMVEFRQKFEFSFVIMLGDNIYGGKSPAEMKRKFETPYKPLLDAGVQFYASLGNHDDTNQRFYKLFNMNEQQYYTFKKGNVRFFALDSNYMDPKQLTWVEKELGNSGKDWKLPFFHHPLYSSASFHGPSVELRKILEPLFQKYGVEAVFAGHEHVYERTRPQKGIVYFIEGASGQLRRGDLRSSVITAAGYDQDCSFMIVEISGDDLYFQTISRSGKTVDSGTIHRGAEAPPSPAASLPAPVRSALPAARVQ
jgi:predicted phosphodiesterase